MAEKDKQADRGLETAVIELQVAKGRSIHVRVGQQPRDAKGNILPVPRSIIAYPSKVQCTAATAARLLKTGTCIDPSKPVDEGKLLDGTSSTMVLDQSPVQVQAAA